MLNSHSVEVKLSSNLYCNNNILIFSLLIDEKAKVVVHICNNFLTLTCLVYCKNKKFSSFAGLALMYLYSVVSLYETSTAVAVIQYMFSSLVLYILREIFKGSVTCNPLCHHHLLHINFEK